MRRLFIILTIFMAFPSMAQEEAVQWITFEELEQALLTSPKKVIVHFYADWCAYCKKMENAVYTKPSIKQALKSDYYAIRFNVESKDTIAFGGKTFINQNAGKKRLAYHQIPEFLAGRKGQPLELPATVILDETFTIKKRLYRYIPPSEMLSLLKN